MGALRGAGEALGDNRSRGLRRSEERFQALTYILFSQTPARFEVARAPRDGNSFVRVPNSNREIGIFVLKLQFSQLPHERLPIQR